MLNNLKCFTIIALFLFLPGCILHHKVSYNKLDKPIKIVSTTNYIPEDVQMHLIYTIYGDSEWTCKNKTSNGDYICCFNKSLHADSNWKYCLLVDEGMNAFGFFELGLSSYSLWSEGKQKIFKKVE